MLFVLWLSLRLLSQLLSRLLGFLNSDGAKDLEILVLRQQLRVLYHKSAGPGSPQATGFCWLPVAAETRIRVVTRRSIDFDQEEHERSSSGTPACWLLLFPICRCSVPSLGRI
jgi:hypothetical protein